MNYKIECVDVLEESRKYEGEPFHGILCDPPYGLSFMGKKWDYDVPGSDVWRALLDLCVPGAHLLAFGGSRTYHRMACAIEDAGWEIRDCVMYLYGSGFPKSHDVSKAIDKSLGIEREVVGEVVVKSGGMAHIMKTNKEQGFRPNDYYEMKGNVIKHTYPGSPEAAHWQGYGTALKPAFEPVVVARKPLDGTVAGNALKHGAGALNIDGCRIAGTKQTPWGRPSEKRSNLSGLTGLRNPDLESDGRNPEVGRWPANVIHDGSEEVLELFPPAPGQSGDLKETGRCRPSSGIFGDMGAPRPHAARKDSGSAARFFYCAKASRSEREAGLLGSIRCGVCGQLDTTTHVIGGREARCIRNVHPTVKPVALTEYLAHLILPPQSVAPRRLLVPFSGSGSEAIGAMLAGWDEVVCVEREEAYCNITQARLEHWMAKQVDNHSRSVQVGA